MPAYQSESFYRAKITTPILQGTAVPFTIVLSKLPTLATWLLTISPNTEYEEIVEYNNVVGADMTIDIIKRGIKPTSILLTTNTVDYNNTSFMRQHAQNDIIRGDVNHIHINQSIGNTTLATEAGVGISKLSVAAVDAWDPIVVGTNDPRVGDASTTQKATVKLSVAPVSAANPIAVGDNDGRVASHTIASANGFTGTVSWANAHTISTTVTWLLKGNGTAISAATAWTDFYAPWSTVAVADGGTGRSSHTANSLIIWGTTTTSAQQSITSWASWEVLVSQWAWVAPIFENRTVIANGTYSTVVATVTRYWSWDPLAQNTSSSINCVWYSVFSVAVPNSTGGSVFYVEYSVNWTTWWTTLYSTPSTLPLVFIWKVWYYRCIVTQVGSPWTSTISLIATI